MTDDRVAAKDEGRSALASIGEFVVMIGGAFLLAIVIRTYIIEPYRVPSGSMIPTIQIGDQVLVNKFIYRFQKPAYGEIVILDDPTHETPMLIKRVIAVGGETVDLRDGKVVVDGQSLDEPYTHGQQSLPGTVALPVKLPAGTVWVMGDNRMHSKDSRFFGPQPASSVHGRAFVTYWPFGRLGALR